MAAVKDKVEPGTGKPESKKSTQPTQQRTGRDVIKELYQDPYKYAARFQILLLHMLPSTTFDTYLRYGCVLACSCMKRGLNILIPMQLGVIVEVLKTQLTGYQLFKSVSFWIFLKFLNSGSGISILEGHMWRPIESEASARLNIAAYRHVMTLSSDYHDNKKTGAVWEGVRAGSSVVTLISIFAFNLLPQMFDLLLTMGVLWRNYDASTAAVAFLTIFGYNYINIRNQSRARNRIRQKIDTRSTEHNILLETSTNWPTIAYFNRFGYEVRRYEEAVRSTQDLYSEERLMSMLWGAVQQGVMLIGLGSACLSVAAQVRNGKKSAADFIVFTTYWSQLIGPWTSFVGLFFYCSQILVECERLVELFETQPSVKEAPNASDLQVKSGAVEFKDVTFGYKDPRTIIKGISFECMPGSTTAIVGETGGGKSTILKLMARLYDASGGSITIDHQEVQEVTLNSLREIFGHVPQSVGVFNTTILENLQYGKLDASLEECQEACKAAALHERILEFPDGYETVVGEKGVKLSGGELQRLAIARVVLKNPKILLLDEATSAVDTGTEMLIQESLRRVTRGRTTIVVAHRLSTIAHAEQILVVKDGRIVERGNHQSLLAMQGTYYGLWTRQLVRKSKDAPKVIQRAVSCPFLKMR